MDTFEILNNKLKEDKEDLAYAELKLDESLTNLNKEIEIVKNLLDNSNCELEDISFTIVKTMVDDIILYKEGILVLKREIKFTESLINSKDK